MLHILDQENNMFDNYDLKFQCATLLKSQFKQLGANVHEPYHTHHYISFYCVDIMLNRLKDLKLIEIVGSALDE